MRKRRSWWWQTRHSLGIPEHAVPWRERWVSMLTAAIGLAAVAFLGSTGSSWLEAHDIWLVASIGATAVLVFAVPHGALSQPWAVLMGQAISAVVGVAVAKTVGGGVLAASLAVALAIFAMHCLRCVHPPGGATALAAILAVGSNTPDWSFIFFPVLFDAGLVVIVATALNAPFPWRRYPVSWAYQKAVVAAGDGLAPEDPFSPEQLRLALDQIGSLVDISDDELKVLYRALREQQNHSPVHADDLVPGRYFSNGEVGERWAIRRVVDASEPGAKRPQAIVKTVAGLGRGDVRVVTLAELLAWAAYQVQAGDQQWRRLRASSD